MTEPLVSCLMVTRNRARLAARAVRCFASQSWTRRELVIVDDGAEDYATMLAPWLAAGHVIRYHRLPADPARTLGAARNASLELAQGEFVVQWDDDEWYHPDRLAIQMAATSRLDVVLLDYTLMHLDTPEFVLHPYRANLSRGTPGSVLHRRGPVRYPELARGEDSKYLTQLLRRSRGGVVGVPHSHLFIRCFHGQNTWDRRHFEERLHRTPAHALQYLWARWVRRDLFSHPAFRLTELEHQAFERFLHESAEMHLLQSPVAGLTEPG
jgi:glycosyltransferase involved in cell wall biosynthesis